MWEHSGMPTADQRLCLFVSSAALLDSPPNDLLDMYHDQNVNESGHGSRLLSSAWISGMLVTSLSRNFGRAGKAERFN